ncbi:hypothetical protein FACS1894158_10630 [Betaproteobacteria bacterium]|nr:hypothetical protein FACS1894158_10630 [Betaproteobacteria bacterium]
MVDDFPLFMVAIPVSTILFLGIAGVLWRWHAGRYERRLAAFARRKGWIYSKTVFVPWGPCFDVIYGDAGRFLAEDCIRGRWADTDFVSFMLHQRDSKKDNFQKSLHVVAIETPADLPNVYLTHGHGPGASGLSLEWHDFNRTWKVDWCADPRAAHAFFAPRVMERLMEASWPTKHLRIAGHFLLTWEDEERHLEKIQPIVEHLASIIDLVPRFLWEDNSPPSPQTLRASPPSLSLEEG